MDIADRQYEIPNWVAAVIVLLFAGSLAYGVLIRQSLLEPLLWWGGALRVAVGLFVVYLLYRFVVAVEQIADKL